MIKWSFFGNCFILCYPVPTKLLKNFRPLSDWYRNRPWFEIGREQNYAKLGQAKIDRGLATDPSQLPIRTTTVDQH